ncbi:hypothetical protein EZJ49_12335 [Bdellovibrio bacteriovorus]|uniref:hypothetical protein n=1 Tax=Bdellovibrio bacteriovorus TaxID=959 RepID=UPI0021D1DEA1|nr:hypothetical protein [Bdellovibrio bacteriovorus]UXR63851.1 hypothetical protein EZJ49_12335 [Bdellovibrio bacteriovorus]
MDLSQVSNHELLNRVEKLSRTERKITYLILWHIVEVETRALLKKVGHQCEYIHRTTGRCQSRQSGRPLPPLLGTWTPVGGLKPPYFLPSRPWNC